MFLTTRERGYQKKPYEGAGLQMILRLTHGYPHLRKALLTRAERYNAEMRRIEEMEREGRCLIVRPDHMAVESTTFDTERLAASFAAGRAQALRELPRWREFLYGSPVAGPRTRPTPRKPVLGDPRYIELT